jgi:hypothetical protein
VANESLGRDKEFGDGHREYKLHVSYRRIWFIRKRVGPVILIAKSFVSLVSTQGGSERRLPLTKGQKCAIL